MKTGPAPGDAFVPRGSGRGSPAALVILLCLYALLESAVRAIGQPPWLIDPQTAAERIVALPAGIPPLLLGAIGAVTAAAGLFFFLSAILPGRGPATCWTDRRRSRGG